MGEMQNVSYFMSIFRRLTPVSCILTQAWIHITFWSWWEKAPSVECSKGGKYIQAKYVRNWINHTLGSVVKETPNSFE